MSSGSGRPGSTTEQAERPKETGKRGQHVPSCVHSI